MHIVRSEVVDELLAARDGDGANATPSVLLLRLQPINKSSDALLSASDSHLPREDADGDLDLPRRKRRRNSRYVRAHSPDVDAHEEDAPIVLETMAMGSADVTGVQLWRASFLLAEYLQSQAEKLKDSTVLELGCGVGLVAIAAARSARMVYATDGDTVALAVCERNVKRNLWARDCVRVRHLEWTSGSDRHDSCGHIPDRFRLSPSDPLNTIGRVDWIIASDVFYDDDVADLCLDTLHRLMRHHPTATVIVAAEKRIVFSAFTLDAIALGYDAFAQRQCRHKTINAIETRGCTVSCRACCASDEPTQSHFVATPIPVDAIPRIYEYDRVSTLAIWQLHAVLP